MPKFENLRAGTSPADADSGSEVARKFNDNFAKVGAALEEMSEGGTASPTQVFEPSDEAAMLALDAHKGDFVVRPDGVFLLKQEPASILENWAALTVSSGSIDGQERISFTSGQWTQSGNVWTFSTVSSQYPSGVWKATEDGYTAVLCDMSMNASSHMLTLSCTQAFDGMLVFAPSPAAGEMKAQTKTVLPDTTRQVVLPDEEFNCLSSVTVQPVPYTESENDAGGLTVEIV